MGYLCNQQGIPGRHCDALTTLGSATRMIRDSRCKYGRVDSGLPHAALQIQHQECCPVCGPAYYTSPIVGRRELELQPSLQGARVAVEITVSNAGFTYSQETHRRNTETHTHCVVEVNIHL